MAKEIEDLRIFRGGMRLASSARSGLRLSPFWRRSYCAVGPVARSPVGTSRRPARAGP